MSIPEQPLAPGTVPAPRALTGRLAANAASRRKLWQAVAVFALLGLAAFVRLVNLNQFGYNSDEAVYAGQAAAIAGAPILKDIFPIFRAHPLLFQFVLSLAFQPGVNDVLGRVISAVIGVATIAVVYQLGAEMYRPRAGLIAGMIMALMPYHVVVTRQVLLDGPMAFFAALTLLMLVYYAKTGRAGWLIGTGVGLGLTFLSKEIAIILVGSVYAFLTLSPEIKTRPHHIAYSLAAMVLTMLPYPLAIRLAGAGGDRKTGQYLVWQLFRRPNHTWDFYPTEVPVAMGLLVVLVALAGLWLLRRSTTWREKLLLAWIAVPVVFFQLWPTKGFQYLLPIAPAVALLAARTLVGWPSQALRLGNRRTATGWPSARNWRIKPFQLQAVLTGMIALSLFSSSWGMISLAQGTSFLAGTGGVPGGREAGQWIHTHVPEGATFMTIGPSMANIIKFYGYRDAYGLSVSPNPLHRNPSYDPVYNPDFKIRMGDLQYLVWDSFSAERSSFFSEKLLWYVQKYNGRVVHQQNVTVTTPEGHTVEKPVIIIYEVHPQ